MSLSFTGAPYILTKQPDKALAHAIAKTCVARDGRQAFVAQPMFQIEDSVPDIMLELLMRIEEAAKSANS